MKAAYPVRNPDLEDMTLTEQIKHGFNDWCAEDDSGREFFGHTLDAAEAARCLYESHKNPTKGKKMTTTQSIPADWAVQMMRDSGLRGSPGPDMSETGDGRYYSAPQGWDAIRRLEKAGHQKRVCAEAEVVTFKGAGSKGMTFDFDFNDDDAGRTVCAVRFFDEAGA